MSSTICCASTTFADNPTFTDRVINPTDLVRPSNGETVTAGQLYTIRWLPPTATGDLAILVSFPKVTDTIDGHLSGESRASHFPDMDSDKCPGSIPAGSTSYGAALIVLCLL